MKKKRELMTRALMVVAPLFMLLAITTAWFVSMRVAGVTEQSDITVENMLPGQCTYYMIQASGESDVFLRDVSFIDAAGDPATTGSGIPLAQCVGVYLLPLDSAAAVDGRPLTEKASVTLALERLAGTEPDTERQLEATLLRDVPRPIASRPRPRKAHTSWRFTATRTTCKGLQMLR